MVEKGARTNPQGQESQTSHPRDPPHSPPAATGKPAPTEHMANRRSGVISDAGLTDPARGIETFQRAVGRPRGIRSLGCFAHARPHLQ